MVACHSSCHDVALESGPWHRESLPHITLSKGKCRCSGIPSVQMGSEFVDMLLENRPGINVRIMDK